MFWLLKIKNFFWNKTDSSQKSFLPISSVLSFWRKNTLSKAELLNLFTGYSYVCITAVTEWISGLDRKLFWSENREDREKEHKYTSLITNSFLEEVTWFLEITWICYIRKVYFWKNIEKLEVLRTDLVYQKTNWDYQYNFKWKIYIFPEEDIFIIKHFSPFKDWLWFSPLQALRKQLSMDEAILEWNWNFFENWASSGTTLQTEQNLTQEQKEYLVTKWKSEFMWKDNAHKVAVLDNWIKQEKWGIGQKDMDFVNQRIQIRDEIFTIFRVPKVVVWITDWVGYTDRTVWKTNFAEFKLKPIALKIQEALNKNIFKWIWFFKFINIVPVDVEQLARDYQLWTITLDEYRIKRNYLNVKNWNKNISWEIFEYEENWEYKEFNVENILQKVVKDFAKKDEGKSFSEEFCQKRWEEKIIRTDKYEKEFISKMKDIFQKQENEILDLISKKISKKSVKNDEENDEIGKDDLFSEIAFLIIFQQYFTSFYVKILKNEWQIAISEVGKYDFDFNKIKKFIWERIKKFALEINETTKNEILKIIKNWLKDWIWYEKIKENIKNKFSEYKKSRTEKIARTEVNRAVNKAREEARKQTESVVYKQWWTCLDDRVSKECSILHWKKIPIWEKFYKVWEKDENWKIIEYEDIEWPPKHVNCRCDLIPVFDFEQ